jgi:hypothetical protein
VTPGGWFDDVVFLGESYSLWDSNPLLAGVALFVVLCIALFSGAASAKYSKFHPQSFWALAVQAGLAVLFALAIKWLTSAHYFFSTVISGNTPEDFDSSDFVSDSELLGFSFSWGISELAVIALALAIVVSAFFGARYFANWLPGIFPRFVSVISLRQPAPGEERTSSTAQRLTARGLLALGVLFAIGALSLATAERVFAIVDSPERYVNKIAEGLVSDSIADRKAVFADKGGYEWLPDDALGATGGAFREGFEAQITDVGGGIWQTGGLAAVATIRSVGDQGIAFSFPIRADLVEYPFGFQRAVFSGAPDVPTVELVMSDVLTGDGFDPLLVNGVAVASGTYKALPGSYSVTLEGNELVEAFASKVVVQSGSISVPVEPNLTIGIEVDREIRQSLESIAEDCRLLDEEGNPVCALLSSVLAEVDEINGRAPATYFDFERSTPRESEVTCDTRRDELLSATTIKSTVACEWRVEEQRTYYDGTESRIVRPERFDVSFQYPNLEGPIWAYCVGFVSLPPECQPRVVPGVRTDAIFSGTFLSVYRAEVVAETETSSSNR